MKVVVAHNRYSSAQPSGENAVVAAEIEQLGGAGVQVVPFLRSSDEIPAQLPVAARAALAISPTYAAKAQRELRALLAEQRPDVLHLHNPYPLLSPWVIRTAHAAGVPVVHTLHNFRQTCANGLFFRDGHDCHDCVGRVVPTPAVWHACYRGSRAQSAVMAATLALHRGTWRGLDRVLALTPAMAQHAHALGVPAQRVVVRPNAVADPGPPSGPGAGFLFAGRLSPEKGVGLLLDAWARHPVGALGTLRLAGDGPLAELVRARAADRSDVEFLGHLSRAEIGAAMRRSAVVVVPSSWDEVCPTVAIEALAHGRPVLGTVRGGLPWLIGPAGWTVADSVEALAAVLPTARAQAPGLAATARHAYETRFTPQIAVRTLLDVYRSVTVGASGDGR